MERIILKEDKEHKRKKRLLDFLKELCIIKEEDETATIQIGINQGHILYVEKKAKII